MCSMRLNAVPVIPGLFRSRFIKSYFALIISFSLGSAITYIFCNSSNGIPAAIKVDEIGAGKVDETVPGVEDNQRQGQATERKDELDRKFFQKIIEKATDQTIEIHTKETPTTVQPTTARREDRYPPLVVGDKILTPPDICDGNEYVVFIVVTSSRKFSERKSIRSSWAKKFASTVSESFKVVFVMGCDNENDKRVEREAKRFRDIIRGNYLDSFRQNECHSVKSLLGLKWATTACQSKYVMLSYDDTFVNVATTIKWIKSLENGPSHRQGLFAGFCHGVAKGGAWAVRNPKSQWYISREEYSEDLLPPYASGAAVVLSSDVVPKILDVSKQVRLIHIGDVFIGILARKVGVKCSDFSSRFDTDYTTMLTECEELKFCAVGSVPGKDMFYLTQNVVHLQDICEKQEDGK